MAVIAALLILIQSPATAAEPDGKAIVAERCTSCHDVAGPAPSTYGGVFDRTAPDLFYAGSKFNRTWLVKWLQEPRTIRPSGAMFLRNIANDGRRDTIGKDALGPCPANLNPEEALAVTDYLMTLDDPGMKTGIFDPAKEFSERKALRLFSKQLPCVGCHTIQVGKRTRGGISGPDLRNAGERLNPDWIYARIENPQHWDPKTWMPRLAMSHKKRELLTLFIASMKWQSEARMANFVASGLAHASVAGPGSVLPGSASPGNEVYRLYCSQCHGTLGNGQGINETAGGLAVSPRDHNNGQEMAKLSDEDLRLAIAEGGGAVDKSDLMPPWGNTLSPEQIDQLVLYLRELCQCAAGGP